MRQIWNRMNCESDKSGLISIQIDSQWDLGLPKVLISARTIKQPIFIFLISIQRLNYLTAYPKCRLRGAAVVRSFVGWESQQSCARRISSASEYLCGRMDETLAGRVRARAAMPTSHNVAAVYLWRCLLLCTTTSSSSLQAIFQAKIKTLTAVFLGHVSTRDFR